MLWNDEAGNAKPKKRKALSISCLKSYSFT